MLGYPDQALKKIQETLTLVQNLAHPFSLAYALGHAAWVHQLRREGRATQERAEAAITLSNEQGFLFNSALGTVMRGWALTEQGQGEEGIVLLQQSLAAGRSMGAEPVLSLWLILLAEAYRKAGRPEEGFARLDEALAVMNNTGECLYEPELYRLCGELSLRIGEAEMGRTGDQKILSDSPIPRFLPRGSLLQGHRHRPPPKCQVPGATSGDELEPLVAAAGQEGKSPAIVGGDLRLVSLAELYEGVYSSREPEESGRKLEDFLSGMEIVALEDGICQTFGREHGRLRQERILIGDFDLLIGATCLYHNLMLLTNNARHFARIHNLRIVSLPQKKKTN